VQARTLTESKLATIRRRRDALSLGSSFDDHILEINGRIVRRSRQAYVRAGARFSLDQHRPDCRHRRDDEVRASVDKTLEFEPTVPIYQMELLFNTTIARTR
jgi:hypothetical protein